MREGRRDAMSRATSTTIERSRPALIAVAIAGLLAVVAVFATTGAAASSTTPGKKQGPKPTIVLVHGAWADASGWSGVIDRLQKDGYTVLAPANPLRSLSGDAAYITGVLAQIHGPIVLVGHSYGGAVITNAAAGNQNVRALVYVDAFIPDVGEDILHLAGQDSLISQSIELRGYPPFGPNDAEAYLKRDMYRETFANDLPRKQAAVMAAEQRPIALAAGAGPTVATAWKTIPSWAIVGLDDHTITPAQQLFMAHRAGSTITQIHASHVSMISHPDVATRVIETAANTTAD
jgi:pimeloyl-ACP methyl ester carboxylesterase